MKELANAIKDLVIEYEKACNNPMVNYPIGYALYQTWKKYDLKENNNIGKNKEY